MKFNSFVLSTVLTTLLSTSAGWAQESEAQNAGKPPVTVDQLPPGQLKRDIQRLPPQARDAAMKWLNGFTFPQADFDRLRVDDSGAVYYADDLGNVDRLLEEDELVTTSEISQTQAFSLHSNPSAGSVIFVDFDGHVIKDTAWNNSSSAPAEYRARPFNSEGSETSFSTTELNQIAEIWHRMAEDFAVFDVDVTTEEPASFGPNTAHVLITPNTDANGAPMPASSAGGVAYVNVFGRSNFQYYSPGLVYSSNFSNRISHITEAASHEAGHNLGLSHDGTSVLAYYSGHDSGAGATSWGPIMGTGYNRNVSQWSKGEYADANNQQDDIQIMLNKMGGRPDDHANTVNGATPLSIAADGTINSTTPQTDFNNIVVANKGVVNSANDIDFFSFNAGQGTVDITVTPSWAAWTQNSNRGTNLDVGLSLYDGGGNLLSESDPTDETDARILESVSAGTYYISIRGVGNQFSPYSDYGSQGQFFIEGAIPVGNPGTDTTPPTPNPMTFATVPAGISDSSMSMTATLATDDSGDPVEYYFSSQTAADSGWTSNRTYVANGLAADTEYSWQVKARDVSGNETRYSAAFNALTKPKQPSTDTTPPTPNPMTFATVPAGISDSSMSMTATLATDDSGVVVEYYFSSQTAANSGWTPNRTYVANGLAADTEYSWQVKARDVSGNETQYSAAFSARTKPDQPTPEPPPAVAGLTVTINADRSVTLNWNDITSETSYQVYRETSQNKRNRWGANTLVASLAADSTSYTDRPGSGLFRYYIRSINSAGATNSGWVTVKTTTSTCRGKGKKCS